MNALERILRESSVGRDAVRRVASGLHPHSLSLLPPPIPSMQLLPVVLGVHQYSARLEAARQVAGQLHPNATACCFVDLGGGRVVAEPSALVEALVAAAAAGSSSDSAQLFPFDHVYNSAARGQPGAWGIV